MNKPVTTRAARRAPPKLSRAGAEIVSKLARQTKYADPALGENWPTIAGGRIADLCRPGRLTGGAGAAMGRTLEVYVASGAAAAALQMAADELVERVNRYLGPGAVERLQIKNLGAKVATRSPDDRSKEDESPLGGALASFRAAIKRRNGEK